MDPAKPLRGLRSNFLNEPREDPGPDPRWTVDHRTVPMGDPRVRGPRPDVASEEAALVRRLGDEFEEHALSCEDAECGDLTDALAGEDPPAGTEPLTPTLLLLDDVMEELDWFAEE